MTTMTRTQLLLLLTSLLLFVAYGCTSPPGTFETAVTTGAAGVAAIFAAVKPMLAPETQAKLELIAHNVDGTVQATAAAVGLLVDAITQVKANASTQIAEAHAQLQLQATQMQAQAVTIAQLPTTSEAILIGAGTGTGTSAIGGALLNAKRNATRAKMVEKIKAT